MISAARNGFLEVGVQLVKLGVPVDGSSEDECTPLCWATRLNHVELAHALLDFGAKLSADAEGITPLFKAIEHGHLALVEELVRAGASTTHQSRSNTFPLLIAARFGRDEIARYLLSNGADPNQRNEMGDTALIAAVRHDQAAVARLLFEAGASIRAHNNRHESALALVEQKDAQEWQQIFNSDSDSLWSIVQNSFQ